VADCVDEDCCSEAWIGDGLCDGVDQTWGCDLSCYDCDGGDCDAASCTTCEDDGLITCWDNSCATTTEDCPEGGCTDSITCNYDPEAESDDGSCTYPDCTGNCEGSAVVDECGICEGDGSTCADCTGNINWIADGWCDGSNPIYISCTVCTSRTIPFTYTTFIYNCASFTITSTVGICT
jgi:hypothetical protein